MLSVSSGILLQRIQRRGQHIQIAAAGIFDLYKVLDHMVHFHFFNAAVDPHAMTFVHHDIAHGKLLEAADPVSGMFCFSAPLFLLYRPKNIGFGDQHKLLHRIFEPMPRITLCDQDLSRLQETVPVFTVKSAQFFLLQFFCQTFCPAPGRGKQDHPETVFFQTLQVFDQHGKLIMIGAYRPYQNGILSPALQSVFGVLHQTERRAATAAEAGGKHGGRDHPFRFLRGDLSFLQAVLHGFAVFLKQGAGIFQNTCRFVQNDQAVFGKIIQKGIGLPAEKGGRIRFFTRLFGSRKDHGFLQVFHRPLRLRVKAPDRIHFFIPEFDPQRQLLCQRIDVQDIPANGKLAGGFNRAKAFITHEGQLLRSLLQIQDRSRLYLQPGVFEHAKRQEKIHTAPCTGDDRDFLLLRNRFHDLHTLPRQQVAGDVGLIKDQIPARIIESLRIIQPAVFKQRARF